MKKRIALSALVLAASLLLNSCGLLLPGLKSATEFIDDLNSQLISESEGEVFTPEETDLASPIHIYYHSLDEKEKELYSNICGAIENFSESHITVGKYDSKEEYDSARERVSFIYSHLVYEQPQYFWVRLTGINMFYLEQDGSYTLYVAPDYVLTRQEAEEKKKTLLDAANAVAKAAGEKEGDFEQLLYVYDSIIGSAEYGIDLKGDYDSYPLERSAYGALVGGKTVCSGYALAFNLVLKQMGRMCGAEFDYHNGDPEPDDDDTRHVWNYCKMDDDEYYYFDLTWDDSDTNDKIKGETENLHLYFAVDKEEFFMSHTKSPRSAAPECNGKKYNYYVYKSMNLAEYKFSDVKKLLKAYPDSSRFVIRFDEKSECNRAKADLIDKQRIFEVLSCKSISYSESLCGLHLILWQENRLLD